MVSDLEVRRLFFALWPDASLRRAIYKTTHRLVKLSGGKPVPPANFHITLVFLGNLDAAGEHVARQAAASVTGQRFELQFQRLGFWPEPRVLWLGTTEVSVPERRLAADLSQALRLRGLRPDPKPFMPHLTLARKVIKPGQLGGLRTLYWPVREFTLVHSLTHARGSEYQPLVSWPLSAGAAGSGEL